MTAGQHEAQAIYGVLIGIWALAGAGMVWAGVKYLPPASRLSKAWNAAHPDEVRLLNSRQRGSTGGADKLQNRFYAWFAGLLVLGVIATVFLAAWASYISQ